MKQNRPSIPNVFRFLMAVIFAFSLAEVSPQGTRAANAVVSICDEDHLKAAVGSGGNSVTFSCSGTITLTSIIILDTGTTTIDGSGQSVTISGGNTNGLFETENPSITNIQNITLADAYLVDGFGGAIYNNHATLHLTNVTFSNNQAVAGGAIFSEGSGTYPATVTITNSTFSGNRAHYNPVNNIPGGGGAIHNVDFSNLTVTNSTFSGNYAPNLQENDGYSSGSSLELIGGHVTLKNTIIANHNGGTSNNCGVFDGTLTDGGGNLEDGSACGFSAATSHSSTNPLLGALADNGGPTQTFALLTGSPAIDAGVESICAAYPVNNLDQRGITRPQGPFCDIGAFELKDTTPPEVTHRGHGRADRRGAGFMG